MEIAVTERELHRLCADIPALQETRLPGDGTLHALLAGEECWRAMDLQSQSGLHGKELFVVYNQFSNTKLKVTQRQTLCATMLQR